MTNKLNGPRLTSLRLERGLATRELALDCGIDVAVLRRLETQGDPSLSTLSLAQFLRLADRLNVSADLLLTNDEPNQQPAQQPDDPALLGALLTELANHTQVLIIADALAWDVPRVHAAADALIALLRPTGLTIYRDSGRISLRALDDRHQDATIKVKQDPRLPYAQRILTPARVRKVYRALNGELSEHVFGETDRRDLAVLQRVGLLRYDSDREIVATDDVMRSLYPEGIPT